MRTTYHGAIAIACENALLESPSEILRSGQAPIYFTQRLVVVTARVKVRKHSVSVQTHVHIVVGAGCRKQLRRHLLSLEIGIRVQRVTWSHAHWQSEQLGHK